MYTHTNHVKPSTENEKKVPLQENNETDMPVEFNSVKVRNEI